MRFTSIPISGAYVIDLDPKLDQRGFFARGFCAKEFEQLGLKPTVAQANITFCHKKGTIRGLHYQMPPATEAKLIRCTRGAIHEVIVDMRRDSPSYMQHCGIELTAPDYRMLYIPEMCAAGYQALTDEVEAAYQVSAFYTPECERGLRYNDPALGIRWPLPVTLVSDKDLWWPLVNLEREGEVSYGVA
jgi:dTDP-4-dehydrorhamnose 3,5-epimerase